MSVCLPIKNTREHYELRPSKIIALGLNYRDHIRESQSVNVRGFDQNVPREPILFPKTPNVLIGPGEPILIPSFVQEYGFEDPRVDYEAELAIIIKDKCKNVPEKEAMEHILGFTCMNDVSQRDLQNADRSGWFRGKSLDTFGPVGPCLVRAYDLKKPQNLDIRCRLNGKTVQESNTSHMIFSLPEIVAFVCKNFTLMPGDIIATGTPAGVGRIKSGDRVEVEIEGIGTLENPVEDE